MESFHRVNFDFLGDVVQSSTDVHAQMVVVVVVIFFGSKALFLFQLEVAVVHKRVVVLGFLGSLGASRGFTEMVGGGWEFRWGEDEGEENKYICIKYSMANEI